MAREVSPNFLQGVDVYVLWSCVYAHAHTLHVGYSDVSPVVKKRHLEKPEEIYMYCSDSIPCSVRSTHAYIYAGLQAEVWTNCLFVFFEHIFSFRKKKRRRCEQNHRYLKSKIDLST